MSPLAWAWWRGRHAGDRHLVLVVLAACSLVVACVGWRFYPHYFIPLYVPLAIGAAPWVAWPSSRCRRKGDGS